MGFIISLVFFSELYKIKQQDNSSHFGTQYIYFMDLLDEYLSKEAPKLVKEPITQNIKLDIKYEDKNILVVNKTAGMPVILFGMKRENTLVNALLYNYKGNLSDNEGPNRLGYVHWLDKDASGLVIIAKNNKAQTFIKKQFKKEVVDHRYLVIVDGVIKQDKGTIDLSKGKSHKKPKYSLNYIFRSKKKGRKNPIAEYKVLRRFKHATYIELKLITNRENQIQLYLNSINHPLYKTKAGAEVIQSYKLSFAKPFSSDKIKLEILPDKRITETLKHLENAK